MKALSVVQQVPRVLEGEPIEKVWPERQLAAWAIGHDRNRLLLWPHLQALGCHGDNGRRWASCGEDWKQLAPSGND